HGIETGMAAAGAMAIGREMHDNARRSFVRRGKSMEGTVNFTRMDHGTSEEYQFLESRFKVCYDELPDNVLGALKKLQGDKLGYQVDRFEHSLQTATRAFRDGADEETVVVALLHDIGDLLAPENHGDLAAAVLKPYVSEANHWLVRHHPVFQGYYYYHH